MTVKQLIAQLNRLPPNLNVGVSSHDNSEEECSGWVVSVNHFVKADYDIKNVAEEDMFNAMPDECILLHC